MSKVLNYICEPNSYRIEIIDSTHRRVVVALFIGEKQVLYREYRSNNLDYQVGNKIVNIFCEHIQKDKVKKIEENDNYLKAVKSTLSKVYSHLGLLIWEKN